MEDKYIGLALAMSSSLAIGTSFIITKKGLMDASARTGGTDGVQALDYLQNPIWWGGMITMAIGEIANSLLACACYFGYTIGGLICHHRCCFGSNILKRKIRNLG